MSNKNDIPPSKKRRKSYQDAETKDSKSTNKSYFTCEELPLHEKDNQLGIKKKITFGKVIEGIDLRDCLTDNKLCHEIKESLNKHSFLVFRGQTLTPLEEIKFAHIFDPDADTVWRCQKNNPWERYKATYMGTAGTYPLPDHPELLVVGSGQITNHYGLTARLGGKRLAYGKSGGSQVLGGGNLQWHIDGAFYDYHPPKVNCFICHESPKQPGHILISDDKTNSSFYCPKGSTAFVSGFTAYSLLSDKDKKMAKNISVVYAEHPFLKTKTSSSTKNGLRTLPPKLPIPTAEQEQDLKNIECLVTPGSRRLGKMIYPLIWESEDGKKALMAHPRCMESLKVKNDSGGEVTIKIEEGRALLERLMRPAVDPNLVYAHEWKKGDVAVWDNLGIWHSATGGLSDNDTRIMHLICWNGSTPPSSKPN